MFGLILHRRHERVAHRLYCAAVAAARAPDHYGRLGVPDTLDGRFDMIGLFAFLLIERLRALPHPGAAVAQAVFDAMFSDMDMSLREMGVGDLGVGKRVRAMWEAFHGRAAAYRAPVADADAPALTAALARNVWRDPQALARARPLADIALRQAHHLAAQDARALLRGEVDFLLPEPVAA